MRRLLRRYVPMKDSSMEIKIASSDIEISECFKLLSQLRPQYKHDEFVNKVKDLNNQNGYQLVYLKDKQIKSVAGIRISDWLHTGKYLEIDDLVTCSDSRSKGYGSKIFDWISDYAKDKSCNQIKLVSGVTRERAHRFYLAKGMNYEAKYFSLNL
jgi:GNAT superfamily N-acetyltransferase